MTSAQQQPAPSGRRLINDAEVAAKLGVSERHVHRMREAGTMPAPLKLGAAVRWDSKVIDLWIDEGCQSVTTWGDDPGTQTNFEFAVVYQTTIWSDRNDVKVAKGQVALLAALIAAKDNQGSLDDATANLSDKFEDEGKWRGQITKGLQKDGLIERAGATNSKRKPRNAGLLWRWRLLDASKAKMKIESLKRWIDGIEKPAKGAQNG